MNTKKIITTKFSGLALLLALALFTAGCSDDDTGPVTAQDLGADQYDTMDLALEYGGLTVSDEEAAFDDEGLKALLLAEDDELVADPLAEDPTLLALEAMGDEPADPTDPTRPRFTFLRLRWGLVRGPEDSLAVDPGNCGNLDWTGEIHTDRGLVVVRRALAFERPYDHLILPRLDAQTVAFVSHTGCGWDGLLLEIVERPADFDEANAEPNRLHINTGPYAGVYEVAQLAGLDEVVPVDEVGNQVQLTGFTLQDIAWCPKGFLSGRFLVLPAGDSVTGEHGGTLLGTFAGAWIDLTGRVHGFLRGGYGLDAEGNQVFAGKYIDRDGRFRGLLRGGWIPGEAADQLAGFQGHWVGAAGLIEGHLGGQAHPVADRPGGFFEGRWTADCDDEAASETL